MPPRRRQSGTKKNDQKPAKRQLVDRSVRELSEGPKEKGHQSLRTSMKRTRLTLNAPEARGVRTGPARPSAERSARIEKSTDGMRLQKFLAMAGVDSRRNCEDYIRTGRVTVDGEVITDPARAVDPKTQDIRLDAERLRPPRFRYFLVNKPRGFLCTNSDPQGRPRAIDLVPVADQRLFTVGRLDESTEGMLLVTNDGDLAQRMAHPRFEVIRRYRCLVAGFPQPETLHELREGMYFAEGFFKFRSVRVFKRRGRSTILELELQEGKNREIRRLMARVGHKVLALERIAFGPLKLGSLPPGRHRELSSFEIRLLRQFITQGEASRPVTRGSEAKQEFGYRAGKTRNDRKRTAPTATERSATTAQRSAARTAAASKLLPDPDALTKKSTANATRKRGKRNPAASTDRPARPINKGRDRRRKR